MQHLQVLIFCSVLIFAKVHSLAVSTQPDDYINLEDVIRKINERLRNWEDQFKPIDIAESLIALNLHMKHLEDHARVFSLLEKRMTDWDAQVLALHQKLNFLNDKLSEKPSLINESNVEKRLTVVESKLKNPEAEWVVNYEPIITKLNTIIEKLNTDQVHPRHLKHTCREIVAPFRRIQKDVDYLRSMTVGLFDEEAEPLNKMQVRRGSKLRGFPEVKESLDDVLDHLKTLDRRQERNINENERILRKLDRKIDDLLDDDDKMISIFKRLVSRTEKRLMKAIEEDDDDDDDSDENKKKKDDSDEDDSDESDNKKNKNKNDDDDDDDDDSDDSDDDSDEGKKRQKGSKNSDDDDDSNDDSHEEYKKLI